MARQNIYTGAAPNDGTGDTLRSAAQKINETLVELYKKLGNDSNVLSAQISLEDSAVVFEGRTPNAFETRLVASDVNSDVTIRLPDSDGIVVTSNGNQTINNKRMVGTTLISPTIVNSINDSSDNELIKFSPVSNPVSEISVSNAASGNSPTIFTTSSNNNVDMAINAKGNGNIILSKLALDHVDASTDGQTISSNYSFVRAIPSANNFDITISNGRTVGEFKTITNTSSSYTVTVIPSSFAHTGFNGFILPQDTSVIMVWNGSAWSIAANLSSVTLA